MASLPSGTVTFLFTDIEGSAASWERAPAAMEDALVRHDLIVQGAIAGSGGHIFATGGDSFSAAFHRAVDALVAAVEIQRRLQRERWSPSAPIRVRIGLHTGEAAERDGNYFGSAVNRAARLMATAHGEQLLVSAATAAVLADELPAGVRLVDLGECVLRSLNRAERVFQALAPGIRTDFPPLTGVSSVAGNLPTPMTPFVGRPDDVRELVASLGRQRLVTLVGPGGVGKTRLAIESASLSAREFGDGVCFVDLAPLSDQAVIPAVIASLLRVQLGDQDDPVAAIVNALRGRHMLLALDNCEHVVDTAAAIADGVARTCPTVVVLATSREPLGVLGEQVHRVRSLNEAEGTELFATCARAADSSFAVGEDSQPVVERICRQLDGIPLAIELAASRVRSMTAQEIEAALSDRFSVLAGAPRGGVERHRTLRAAVEWSYELLGEPDRVLFNRLAVLAGSFDAPAVEAICGPGDHDAPSVPDRLRGLVERSLVVAEPRDGTMRYRLLETMRQLGLEHLSSTGEIPILRDRHLQHYASTAGRLRSLYEETAHGLGDSLFDADWDNLRAAVEWAFSSADVERLAVLVEAVGWYAYFRLRLEFGEWSRRASLLTRRPQTFGVAARFTVQFGDPHEAERLADEGITHAAAPTDPDTTACHWARAAAAWYTGRPDEAWSRFEALESLTPESRLDAAHTALTGACFAATLRSPQQGMPYLERAADLASELRSTGIDTALLWASGVVHLKAGRHAEALEAFQQVLALEDSTTFVSVPMWAAQGLAAALAELDQPDARQAWAQSLRRLYQHRNLGMLATALEGVALWSARHGEIDHAAVIVGYLNRHGHRHAALVDRRSQLEAKIAADEHAIRHLRQGARLALDDVISYALTHLETLDHCS